MIDHRFVAFLFIWPTVLYIGIAGVLFDIARDVASVVSVLSGSLQMVRAAVVAGLSLLAAAFVWVRGPSLASWGRVGVAVVASCLCALSWNIALLPFALLPALASTWWWWQGKRRGA